MTPIVLSVFCCRYCKHLSHQAHLLVIFITNSNPSLRPLLVDTELYLLFERNLKLPSQDYFQSKKLNSCSPCTTVVEEYGELSLRSASLESFGAPLNNRTSNVSARRNAYGICLGLATKRRNVPWDRPCWLRQLGEKSMNRVRLKDLAYSSMT